MKIIIVDPFSTSPNYSNTIAHYLSELDHKVYLVGANRSINNMSSRDSKIIRHPFISSVLDYPLAKKFYFFQNLTRLILYPFALMKIYFLVIRNNVDVLHFQWSHIPILELILVFLAQKRCSVVYTFHNTTRFHGERHFILEILSFGSKTLIKKIDKVIVHTEYSKKTFSKSYPEIINKIYVVPRGKDYFLADNEIDKEETIHNDEDDEKEIINILFFGQISFYKGVDILIESAPFLKSKNFKFQIYGRSELDEKNLFDLASKNGVSEKISWKIKFLSNLEVHKAYENADILVFPYRHIDQSSVLMSALGYGKPIVASKVGGFEEILKHRVNGLLFDKENPKELAKHLDELILSPEKRKSYGEANLNLSNSWPSWLEISETTLNVYNK